MDIRKYLVFLLFLPFFGVCQEKEQNTNLLEMGLSELVNVTIASNVVNEFDQQPVSITTISKKQLELSGARTLAEAIATYVPGFFVVEDQDDLIAGFRGLAPDNNSNILFLMNGQNLNTEWFWGPPMALLNSTQMSYIERVEVIRGPGSVTLGQGALMGVINIITKKSKKDTDEIDYKNTWAGITYGKDNFIGFEAATGINEDKIIGNLYFAQTEYNGQQLRNEGWVKDRENEGYKGSELKIYDIGTRLNKSEHKLFMGTLQVNKFKINILYADGKRDLYNFYRDRNVFGQELFNINSEYGFTLFKKIQTKIIGNYSFDSFSFNSVEGADMGGTRENRAGIKLLANFDEFIKNNKLAVGLETNYYQFGRKNLQGNNFLLNVLDTSLNEGKRISLANSDNKLGYGDSYNVYSIFAEDYYSISKSILIFGALRFDAHPFWGNNLSPRMGIISNISNKFSIRASFQTGFRGAVGLHYSGGYQHDGFLRASNYSEIEKANIPISSASGEFYHNIDEVKPMKLKNYELAFNYKSEKIRMNSVFFFNSIENVIDVGVIYADPAEYLMPNIGTDEPGDWNGYWYFKNIGGTIHQAGFEITIGSDFQWGSINASHSMVMLAKSSDEQKGSMFVTNNGNIQAYPENVTRLHAIIDVLPQFSLGLNYLYYYSWYSPSDTKVNGNHLVDLTGQLRINEHVEASFIIKNLLGQANLYPMNNNSGDADLSKGTPSVESTTFWMKIKYRF